MVVDGHGFQGWFDVGVLEPDGFVGDFLVVEDEAGCKSG